VLIKTSSKIWTTYFSITHLGLGSLPTFLELLQNVLLAIAVHTAGYDTFHAAMRRGREEGMIPKLESLLVQYYRASSQTHGHGPDRTASFSYASGRSP
jgi:hypothetical protein